MKKKQNFAQRFAQSTHTTLVCDLKGMGGHVVGYVPIRHTVWTILYGDFEGMEMVFSNLSFLLVRILESFFSKRGLSHNVCFWFLHLYE